MITIQKYVRAQSLEEAWQLNQNKRSRILGGMLWLRAGNTAVHTAIDLSDLGLDAAGLRDAMRNKWQVLCDPGSYYDTKDFMDYTGPEHHIRMNLAAPRPLVEQALDRIRKYYR